MPYQLSDIFIGNFPKTQSFGEREQFYNARFGLKGHNGTDYGCPVMTPLVVTADGWVSERGFDAAGYGNYVKVVHDGYLTLYAHLNDVSVSLKERVIAGQLLGHSGQTGLADGPHLHFGIAPCDANGIKTETANGYSGYIDAESTRCEWHLMNLTAPVRQNANEQPAIGVPSAEFQKLVAKSTTSDIVMNGLISYGVNEYLQSQGQGIIDWQNNPTDSEAGKKAVSFIGHLVEEKKALEEKVGQVPSTIPLSEGDKLQFLDTIKQAVSKFLFKQP